MRVTKRWAWGGLKSIQMWYFLSTSARVSSLVISSSLFSLPLFLPFSLSTLPLSPPPSLHKCSTTVLYSQAQVLLLTCHSTQAIKIFQHLLV